MTKLNVADTFVSHDRSMVSHWALLADQMKNGFRTFLKTAVSLRRGSSLFSIYLQYMIDVVPVFHPCDHPSSAIPTIDISIGVCVFSVF